MPYSIYNIKAIVDRERVNLRHNYIVFGALHARVGVQFVGGDTRLAFELEEAAQIVKAEGHSRRDRLGRVPAEKKVI